MPSELQILPELLKPQPGRAWDEKKMGDAKAAYAMGVPLRAISQATGIPAGTLFARSYREGWTAGIEKAKEAVRNSGNKEQAQASGGLGALAIIGEKSKLALAKAAHRGATAFSQKRGDAIIENSGALLQITKAAKEIHGWNPESKPVTISLELLASASREKSVEAVEVESSATIIADDKAITSEGESEF